MTVLAYPIDPQAVVDLDLNGRDLTSYTKELTNVRETRCLNLRRSFNLCSNRTCKCNGKFYICPKRSSSLNSFANIVTHEDIIQTLSNALSSPNASAIESLCTNLATEAEQSPKTILQLIKNQDVQEAFVTFLDENSELQSTVTVLNMLSTILKSCVPALEDFIDIGLSSQLLFLLSTENENVLKSTINLIGVVSGLDGYARDAIICLGIHQSLIELAGNNRGTEIALMATEALHSIYGNPSPIDTDVIKDSCQPVVAILEGQTEEVINNILMILVDFTSKQTSIVFTLSKIAFYEKICDYIRNPNLTYVALKLCGNMSVSQPNDIKTLLQNGILDILLSLLSTPEYAADSFWVLSNLLESLPEAIVECFDENFVESVLKAAEDASFDVKREASFFISTLIVFGGTERIEYFFNERVFGILSDVLGCGVETIQMRSIDALVTILLWAQSSGKVDEFLQLIKDSDLADRLREFEDEPSRIGQRVRYILSRILD